MFSFSHLFSFQDHAIQDSLFSNLNDRSLVNLSICSKETKEGTDLERKYRQLRKEEKPDEAKLADLFFEACNLGSLTIVNFACESGVIIDERNSNGRTVLHIAALRGRVKLITFLVQKGLSVNSGDFEGNTPLIFASANGQNRAVKLLHRLGADLNSQNSLGWTPLIFSISYSQPDVFDYLMKNGVDVNRRDNNFISPLQYAIRKDRIYFIKELCIGGADPVEIQDLSSSFFEAIVSNKPTIVTYFCERGEHEKDIPQQELLKFAISRDLIKSPKELKKGKLTTLGIAIKLAESKKLFEIVKILKNAPKIRKIIIGLTEFMPARLRGDKEFFFELFETLLQQGFEEYLLRLVSKIFIPFYFFNMLNSLLTNEDLLVKILIKLFNIPDFDTSQLLSPVQDADDVETLLHFAMSYGFVKFVQVLIVHGNDPRTTISRGENGLQYVLRNPSQLTQTRVFAITRCNGIKSGRCRSDFWRTIFF